MGSMRMTNLSTRLTAAMQANAHGLREAARAMKVSRSVIYAVMGGKVPTRLYLAAVERYCRKAEKKTISQISQERP